MGEFIAIIIGAILVKNFVLARFLGLCPFIGVSKKTDTALGMGMAVTFVMTLASIVTWLIHLLFLAPTKFNLIYQIVFRLFDSSVVPADFNFVLILRTLTFILVIATLVQFVEMFIKKASPALYDALGIYLPLITTNCAVLGVAVLNSQMFFGKGGVGDPVSFSFLKAVVHGFAAGIGFTVAMLLMSGIRERLEDSAIPESLRGVPIAFICTSFMALAFGGFTGLI
jgi:electron transport complex protein RnfA